MRKTRTCLYPSDWPRMDREALDRGLGRRGLFDTSDAAHWSTDTLDLNIRGHGTFLFFAQGRGELRTQSSPAARARGQLLIDFINDSKARLQPSALAITLRSMAAMLRVIDPDGDRSEVEAAARYYRRIAKHSRDKRKIVSVGASELYYAGLARMERLEAKAITDPVSGVAFGDGLMMAMLAANPVRLKNVHGSRSGVHVVQTAGGNYECRFSPSETKNRERVQAELPASLTRFIERWLNAVRPFLLGANNHDAMWMTSRGNPMSRPWIYSRFCNATEEELGVRINPHAVRHIAATSIAVSMPASAKIIPFVLHNDARTAQEHYNLADQLSASYQYLRGLEQRRQQALTRTNSSRNGDGKSTKAWVSER
jgi:integrase/recombinase XerD